MRAPSIPGIEAIREAIFRSGRKDKDVAQDLGLPQSSLSHLLAGRRKLTPKLARRAHEVLGIPLATFGLAELPSTLASADSSTGKWQAFAERCPQFACHAALARDAGASHAALDAAAAQLERTHTPARASAPPPSDDDCYQAIMTWVRWARRYRDDAATDVLEAGAEAKAVAP